MRPIETDRLTLRAIRPDDAAPVLAMFADPEVLQYLVQTGEPVRTVDQMRERIEAHVASYADRPGLGFYVVERRASGEFLGRVGLYVWDIDGASETEITYVFPKSSWGHGFATEAAGALRDFGFGTLHIPRLVSCIMPENAASANVVRRLGATYERRIEVVGHAADLYVHHPAVRR